MPPKTKAPDTDADTAAAEATAQPDDTVTFTVLGDEITITRDVMQRLGVQEGIRLSDASLIAQGVLGTAEYKAFIRRHVDEDTNTALTELMQSLGKALGIPNSSA
jgi:hypothetical protein